VGWCAGEGGGVGALGDFQEGVWAGGFGVEAELQQLWGGGGPVGFAEGGAQAEWGAGLAAAGQGE
jgi:hypothetical protein